MPLEGSLLHFDLVSFAICKRLLHVVSEPVFRVLGQAKDEQMLIELHFTTKEHLECRLPRDGKWLMKLQSVV